MTDSRTRQSSPFDQYVASVEKRLREQGYARRPDGPEGYRTTVFHDQTLSVRKFGFVDSFVVIGEFQSLEPGTAQAYSQAAFRYGLEEKKNLPRGLGSSLVVYPVLVGHDVPPRVLDWVEQYRANHWSAFEFPVVVDLTDQQFFYNDSTPLWGAIYYDGFQTFADQSLAPVAGR